MGRILKLSDVEFLDGSLPYVVEIDPIEAPGSLMLIEPAHPVRPWPAGVPSNGASLPNALWERAIAAYGSGVEASVKPTLVYINMDGTHGAIERSTKGGLHAIISQNVAYAETAVASLAHGELNIDAKLREWQYLHPGNDIYFSVWGRTTRTRRTGTVSPYTGGATETAWLALSAANYRFVLGDKWISGIQGDIGNRNDPETTLGPFLANIGDSSWTTGPANATATLASVVFFGPGGGFSGQASSSSSGRFRTKSWVFYRLYIEDLTVSGRTYSQVDALDLALYTDAVLTPGGRYYGDTYTDPATVE